ncbi:energy transducer TonB [Altibacter sp.]|uniref:energy transducer TonB n=1 Tax=Altibacter sp. TaxID=2024823 RepID=UPI00258AFE9D|nr:energy transducer TonB [Altibacter sp.]MCW9038364.1 energy transducer TonB [Altibacter sp.]
MEIKKNPSFDLGRRSLLFFQIGMIVMLFITWQALEWKSYDRRTVEQGQLEISDAIDEVIPITDPQYVPPPPPPPSITPVMILQVEDEADVEESIIESTETNQNDDIVDILAVEEIEEETEEEEIVNVPFAVIENVPIYPGCEDAGDNNAKKKCMSDKVDAFVRDRFRTDLATELGLEGKQRIFVQFKIDKQGNVTDVRARAPHPKLEEEAVKIIKSLPKMIPGKQRGVPVGVLYGLPILFQVAD